MGPVFALAAATVAGPAVLLAWSLLYTQSCWVLLIPGLVAVVLTLLARERAVRRRRCLADCWFADGALFHRLLRSRILITLFALVGSMLLAGVLMAAIPVWSFEVLALLSVDALLISLLYFMFLRAAAGALRVNPEFRSLLARRWTIVVNVPLVVVALTIMQLQRPVPEYIVASDLIETVHAASDSVGSDCLLVDRVVRLGREAEAVSWWLAINGTQTIDDRRIRWGAWLIFLLGGTLSLWAYSGFCVQLVSFADRNGVDQ